MWYIRRLERVAQELEQLGEQGNVEGFFSNTTNADNLRGLVEDIRDAVMDYQVCHKNKFNLPKSETHSRLRCSKTSITRIANLL